MMAGGRGWVDLSPGVVRCMGHRKKSDQRARWTVAGLNRIDWTNDRRVSLENTLWDLINPGRAFLGGGCLMVMAETPYDPKVHY